MRYLALLVLSALVCVITVAVQQPAAYTAEVPFATRSINALLSCGAYIYQMFLPVKLAPFYPYRVGALSIWILAGVILVLVLITLAAIGLRISGPCAGYRTAGSSESRRSSDWR